MKIVGLTGNIACGKSAVAKMLESMGAKIIDADRIARLVVEPGEPAWREIVEIFGEEILRSDGTIDRNRLGEVVFRDKDKREELNRITHPQIVQKIKELIEEYAQGKVEVVVVEAALIVEKGGMKPLIGDLIVVTADRETQIARLIERNGFSPEEAAARIESQMPLVEKVKHADYVIDNSGTLETTKQQVGEVWKKIQDA